MSVLETPRIYFSGQVAWDPIVTNNYSTFYDEDDAEPVFPTVPDRVKAFRAEAIAAVPKGNWNPHGTHRSTFFDSGVTGADLGAGLVTDDPFVGSPAALTGMLVDLEPWGAFSSQLFFDTATFGIDGGYRILAPRHTRFTARYINFARTAVGAIAGVASVVWTTSVLTADGLHIDAYDSPALQALATALEDDDVLGLTVRFNAYRTVYYDTPVTANGKFGPQSAQLVASLTGGGFQPNPARSRMVGVIGLLRAGEPADEPGDRMLVTGPDDNPRPPTVGSAAARLTDDAIVLDLSNSISETDLDSTKNDFGTLSVVAVPPAGDPVPLATLDYSQYDRDAYLATSGIVTLPVAPADVATARTADLQLRDAAGHVLLAEAPLRAIPLVPNVYVDQGDSATLRFQLYDRGVPAGAGTPVTVCSMSTDSSRIVTMTTLTSGDDGTVSLPVTASTGVITPYVPAPGPNPALPQQGIDPQVDTYLYLRCLPADDGTAALPPTWDNVYARVLSNWHAMAPCMDNWLDLGNEDQVRALGPLLKALTDPGALESYRFMPVTRDMTRGERALLYAFLDSPASGAAAAPDAGAGQTPVERVRPAVLSRRMRS